MWIAGRRDSTLFGVVDDTTTTKFTGRACAVHCNSLPVVVVVLRIDSQFFRHLQDSGTVNSRGRNLLEICTALNLRIFNGRIVGDLEGKKTCFHYNGSSVVDYVIGSKAILQNMRYFIVNPLMPHLSDHCHVTYAIKATLTGSPVSSSCSNGCTLSEHYRLLWDTKLKNKLKECLESQIVQSNLQAALKNDNSDFKIHYGEALVRQTCERLLPVTSLVVVQASFPAVGRLSGTANTPS